MDRTDGRACPYFDWHYDAASESVVIDTPAAYHEYTVSFLAYLIWDPVHMYNSVINDWKDVEHQIRSMYASPRPTPTPCAVCASIWKATYVNVVRFTTFFHLFTLVFDELAARSMLTGYTRLLGVRFSLYFGAV